jgi:hypothetical protein
VRRLLPLAAALLLARGARADEPRLPGEAAELTAEVRTKAQAHVDAIVAGKEPAKAARSLLQMGPAVWPVVEEKMRVIVDAGPRPWFHYLKALLVPKADPDFEALRARLRRTILSGRLEAVAADLAEFRRGRPDPAQRGKFLPHATPPTDGDAGAKVYRSPDGTIVVAFGMDGTREKPDAGDAAILDPTAGFVAAVGGRGTPAQGVSGRAGHASVVAENGFAFAYAPDGSDGQKPDGQGGDGGVAEGRGGAGQHVRQGKMGRAGGG